MLPEKIPVVIVGGGPCGLMLANELGRRGIGALVLDQKPGTAFNPQANATQALQVRSPASPHLNSALALWLSESGKTDLANQRLVDWLAYRRAPPAAYLTRAWWRRR